MATAARLPSLQELHESRSDEAVCAVLHDRMKSKSFISEENMTNWFGSLDTENPEPIPTPDIHT